MVHTEIIVRIYCSEKVASLNITLTSRCTEISERATERPGTLPTGFMCGAGTIVVESCSS